MVGETPACRSYVSCNGSSRVLVFQDTTRPGSVSEQARQAGPSLGSPTTVVRGVLLMPMSGVAGHLSGVLLDICGRNVLDLIPGANDVSLLAPGVYFVREEPQSHKLQAASRPEGRRHKIACVAGRGGLTWPHRVLSFHRDEGRVRQQACR